MQKKSCPNKVNLSVMVLLLIGQFDTIKFGAPGGHWRLTFDLSKDEIRCSFTKLDALSLGMGPSIRCFSTCCEPYN
jgi:hypothetical protein